MWQSQSSKLSIDSFRIILTSHFKEDQFSAKVQVQTFFCRLLDG